MGLHVYIADFGLARLADNNVDEYYTGSPGYMAPEILLNKEYSFKSDMFSLGVILFNMITKKPLFRGRTV